MYSQRGIDELMTLLIWGYILRCGKTYMSAPDWKPLLPVLEVFIYSRKHSQEGVYELIRQRVSRLKRQKTKRQMADLRREALADFDGVRKTLYSESIRKFTARTQRKDKR